MLVRNWLLHENTALTKERIKTIINKELHRQENRPEAHGLRPVSFLVAGKGIEPLTRGFSVPCSTN